jgi:hypothetical protein
MEVRPKPMEKASGFSLTSVGLWLMEVSVITIVRVQIYLALATGRDTRAAMMLKPRIRDDNNNAIVWYRKRLTPSRDWKTC